MGVALNGGCQLLGHLLLLLLLDAHCCSAALDHHQQSHEWLIGWKGESYQPAAVADAEPNPPQQGSSSSASGRNLNAAPTAAASQPLHEIDLSTVPHLDKQWVQVLSWQPRLHLHHNFLSGQECDDLIALRTASQGGQSVQQVDDQLLYTIEQRLADWTALPATHIEGWQMQQGFEPAELASLHMDLLTNRLGTEDFQRMRTATVFIFLSDTEPANAAAPDGKDRWSLVFPAAAGGSWRGVTQPEDYLDLLDTGKQMHEQLTAAGIAAQGQHRSETEVLQLNPARSSREICNSPASGLKLSGFRKGSALLIWNLLVDGQTPDPTAAHVACAPGFGSKGPPQPWIATTWLHNMPAGQDDALGLAAACVDKNPQCSEWAAKGFCNDAPGIMIGLRGLCRYSCNDCNICRQPGRASSRVNSLRDDAAAAAAPAPSAGNAEAAAIPDEQVGSTAVAGVAAAPAAPERAVEVVDASTMRQYVECLYQNMHSLRQAWSEKAREAGVRRARNAIRRDMKVQAGRAGAVDSGVRREAEQMPTAMVR